MTQTLTQAGTPWRAAALVLGTSILMTVAAKVSVPFYPMTMQGAVAVMAGMILGPRLALAAMALYLVQGAVGLPVFTGTPARGIGIAYMMGPTGGYLIGFALTAWLAGVMAERGWTRSLAGGLAVSVGAIFAMYLPGLLWLGAFTGYGTPLLAAGLVPFILGDLTKAAVAALIARGWSTVATRGDAS